MKTYLLEAGIFKSQILKHLVNMPISDVVQMRGTLDDGIHILFLSFFPWVVINYTEMCLEISCCSIFGLLVKIVQERMI